MYYLFPATSASPSTSIASSSLRSSSWPASLSTWFSSSSTSGLPLMLRFPPALPVSSSVSVSPSTRRDLTFFFVFFCRLHQHVSLLLFGLTLQHCSFLLRPGQCFSNIRSSTHTLSLGKKFSFSGPEEIGSIKDTGKSLVHFSFFNLGWRTEQFVGGAGGGNVLLFLEFKFSIRTLNG